MVKEVGIIILNWNGKEDTIACLHSLEQITYKDVEIVLVDNGSTDGSPEFFKTHFPHITLIQNDENLGYAEGNNVGINYGLKKGFSFFVLLNNDTLVDPGFIEPLLAAFKNDPTLGIAGPKTYLFNRGKALDHIGGMWNKRKILFDSVGYNQVDEGDQWEKAREVDYIQGSCMVIGKRVLDQITLFDPRFFLMWEEADLCFRAKNVGFKSMFIPSSHIWHKGGASFTASTNSHYFIIRNNILFVEKNFKGLERLYYIFRLTVVNGSFYLALKILRYLQMFLSSNSDHSKNKERIRRYNIRLGAIHDYVRRRFGVGNSKKFMNCQ